jgi:hypothetical protein
MTPDNAITGAYVDGFGASVEQASQALRSFLADADFVSVVVSNGHEPTHLVTFTGIHARELADLVAVHVAGTVSDPVGGG